MLAEEKHPIDNYFRERLFDLETPPPSDVWSKLEENFAEKKSKKMWVIIASAAATVAIVVSTYIGYEYGKYRTEKVMASSQSSIEPTINNPSTLNQASESNRVAGVNNNQVKSSASVYKSSIKTTSVVNQNQLLANNTQAVTIYTNNTDKPLKSRPRTLLSYKKNKQPLLPVSKPNYSPVITKAQSDFARNEYIVENFTDELADNTVVLGANVIPSYSYRDIKDNNSEKSSSYYNSNENAVLAYSGGVNVGYEYKRWRFESGVYYANIKQQNTSAYLQNNSVELTADPKEPPKSYIASPSSDQAFYNSYGVVRNELSNNERNDSKVIANSGTVNGDNKILTEEGSMDFNFGFIEIPLNIQYKLIDRATDVYLTSGISTNILVRSENQFVGKTRNYDLGEMQGTEKYNFAGMFGVSMQVPVWRKLFFSVEPQFKYFLNSFNKTGEVNTHFFTFGLRSGLSYKF